MKLKALVFGVPVLALLVGLGPVVFAQGGDPLTLFTDNVAATGPSTAVTGMEQEPLDGLNGATISIDTSIYSLNRVSVRDALIDAHKRGVTVRVVADDDVYDENHNRSHDADTAQAYLAAFQAFYDARGDETLCPRRIFLPIVMINSSGVINPPPPILPVVRSLDGLSVEAGSDLRVKLEYHAPAGRYDVYVYHPSLGYAAICTNLETDVFGSVAQATCHVPVATVRGCYQLVTIQAGGDMDPANHVAEGDFIDVLSPAAPLLIIQDSSRWPPGSTITFQLLGHNPCPPGGFPCPPYQEYDIALIGPGFPAPGTVITTVGVDVFGAASAGWSIPSWLAPGAYTVVTFEANTIDPVFASAALDIVQAEIVVQGGNRWPAGTGIGVHLRGHVPNRTYRLHWIDGGTAATIDMGTVTTDAFGNTPAPVAFQIPPDTADSPPAHRIVSFEEGGGGQIVASEDVEVFTP